MIGSSRRGNALDDRTPAPLTDEQVRHAQEIMGRSPKTHEQTIESRLTVIAWSTGIIAALTVISVISGLIVAFTH